MTAALGKYRILRGREAGRHEAIAQHGGGDGIVRGNGNWMHSDGHPKESTTADMVCPQGRNELLQQPLQYSSGLQPG